MMDEESFIVLYFALIALATGIVTGVTIAGTFLGTLALVLAYIMLVILWGMLALGEYWQWKEMREKHGEN